MTVKIKNDDTDFTTSSIGGKAFNLYRLKSHKFNVPDFFLKSSNEINKTSIDNIEKEIKEKIIRDDSEYIIRSSANVEDNIQNSFAGMFESKRIIHKNNFKNELVKVMESSKSQRVISYIKSKRIRTKPKLSLIIQKYVSGDVSGVMFSSISKDGQNGVFINANFGGAESIVDGADCDSYFIGVNDRILSEHLYSKKRVLNQDQVKSLVKLAREVQKKIGEPQDIEWTIKNDKIYILQSRPITKQISQEIFVWDNSNIAESYSGIVLPLTSSYIKYAYKITYMDLARRSSVSEKKIEENEPLFDGLLGIFYGRVYYNMLNWYRMLTLYPRYERNKQNLDTMISAKSKEELETEYHKNVSLLFKTKYYSKLLLRYPFFNGEVTRFKRFVRSYLENFNRKEIEKMDEKKLVELFRKSAEELLGKWSITVENDYLLMTYFGMLKSFCKKNKLEDRFVQLISNIKDVMSAEQVSGLKKLSNEFYKHKTLVALAKKKKYHHTMKQIEGNKEYFSLKVELNKYSVKYGGRFANELKLETSDADIDPSYLLKLLLLYSGETSQSRTKKKVINELSLGLAKRKYLNYLLKRIKFYARQREELRLLRAQSFNVARKIFLEIGSKYEKKKILSSKKDIFYLNVEEIIESIDSKSKQNNLKKVVMQRKRQYKNYANEELEDVFYTYGNSIESKFLKDEQINKDFVGQGCSPGIIKGKVKVLESFSLSGKENYEIVVTKHTDPGWTPLFGLCKGIIVEHGGLLSHAAIISRELDLPCIIGLKDATKKLKDGQVVTLNGYTGEVKIHD
jgi:pyruvate,water dikinase|tara:strand:- start:7089 stop:9473 length:2385 start_codon:yes stop_codon:yes gene_type:complete